MADRIISSNELDELLRQKIQELPSVQDAYIYGGEFEEKDFDYFKGSVEYGTTCLIVCEDGQDQQSRNKRVIESTNNYFVFIIGLNDIDDDDKIAASKACKETKSEIVKLVLNNAFDQNILKNELGNWRNVENTIDKDKRVSIIVQSFSLTYKSDYVDNIQLN